jgi:lysyl-tRNA synthetase class I
MDRPMRAFWIDEFDLIHILIIYLSRTNEIMDLLDSYYESAYLESWLGMTVLSEECRRFPVTQDNAG